MIRKILNWRRCGKLALCWLRRGVLALSGGVLTLALRAAGAWAASAQGAQGGWSPGAAGRDPAAAGGGAGGGGDLVGLGDRVLGQVQSLGWIALFVGMCLSAVFAVLTRSWKGLAVGLVTSVVACLFMTGGALNVAHQTADKLSGATGTGSGSTRAP